MLSQKCEVIGEESAECVVSLALFHGHHPGTGRKS